MEAGTIEAPSDAARDEAEAALAAEQKGLDGGGEFDGRDLPDGAADDEGGDILEPAQQDGLFDQVIEDEELAAALDKRQKAKDARKAAQAAFKERHDVVKGKLDALDLEDGTVVRCGRHRVEVKRVAARSVSFETSPSRRLQIKLLEDS
jgi:hypothetical protein